MADTLQVKPDVTPDPAKPAAGATVTQQGNVTRVTVDPNAPPERPDYIPEKFWKGNIEDSTKEMAKSYSELEKKQSQSKPPEKPAADLKVTPPAPSTEQVQKQVTDAGLDFSKLEQEYLSNSGKLSDASYESLAKAGLPRDTVDNYIRGQEAVAAQVREGFTKIAGDEQGLKDVLAWAGANLTNEQQQAYNKVIESGDVNAAQLAFRGIHAAYVEANGQPGKLQTGTTGAATAGIQPYESNAQVVADMSKPEYKTDPAFRAKVSQRIAVSKVL